MSAADVLPAAESRIKSEIEEYFRTQPDIAKASMKAARKFVEGKLRVSLSGREQKAALKVLIMEVADMAQAQRAEAATAASVAQADVAGPAPAKPTSKAVRAAKAKTPKPPKAEVIPLSDEEALEAARGRKLLSLGPDLRKMCGGARVSIRQLMVRKVWAYIKENQLSGEGKTVKVDDTIRGAGGDLISPEATFISNSTVMKLVQKQTKPFTGEPPEEVVSFVKAQGRKPKKAARGTKRSREAEAAQEAGLAADFKLLKKPRTMAVLTMDPVLQAVCLPERAALVQTTRSHALKWVWEYIRAKGLASTAGGLTPTPELVAFLGEPGENGLLDRKLLMKQLTPHMVPFDGPVPHWLLQERREKQAAYDAQRAELSAKGIDSKALTKGGKRAKSSANGALSDKMFALDDALTALAGFRIASRHVLVAGARQYILDQGLSTDPDTVHFTPDATVQAVVGHSKPMLLRELTAHLAGRITPVPTTWQEGVEQGVVNFQDFVGSRFEARVREAFQGQGDGGEDIEGKEEEDVGLTDAEAAALEAAGQA